jgi:F0F1-type ATP synthase membrane subunit b/b'
MSTTQHPGHLAAIKFQEFTTNRHAAKAQRLKAAELRALAKAEALKADAYAKRIEAKECSKRALEARQAAANAKTELEKIIVQAAGDLVARLPAEYGSWGVIKTRAYMKLLAFLSQQAKAQNPKLALCTKALGLMRDHSTWTDAIFSKVAAIKGMPKDL